MNNRKKVKPKGGVVDNLEFEENSRAIMDSILQSFILQGKIKIGKKSKNDLFQEMHEVFKKEHGYPNPKAPISFGVVLDYRNDFLNLAEDFFKKRKFEVAVIFYAIWFEHWVNAVILDSARKQGLDEKLGKALLRSPIDSKLGEIWQGLGLTKLKRQNVLKNLLNCRNEIVHYKYRSFDPDEEDHSEDLIKALEDFSSEIPALKVFYSKTFFESRFDELFGKGES